jgi:predicted secreted hydrolase
MVVLEALLSGCATGPHRPLLPATPAPTATLAPIRLPADDAPHNDLTEWWYYTGHLAGQDGKRYGFEFVVFQIERKGVPVVYAAHAAVTDHQRGEFHFDQKTWTADRAPATLDLGNGAWRLQGGSGPDRFAAALPGYGLDLTVSPSKPPALHGNDGVISFGPVGDSYYYSDTRLAVTGTLDDHGVRETVTGEAWKDRQWGNFLVMPGGGWDWFSLQLGDGTDVMLFLLRDLNGNPLPSYGTLDLPDGRTQPLGANAALVRATDSWTSSHTGATYPSGWSVQIPGRELQLRLAPVLRDQELDVQQSTGNAYWEGEVTANGEEAGHPIAGQGYVELTGYAKPRGQ